MIIDDLIVSNNWILVKVKINCDLMQLTIDPSYPTSLNVDDQMCSYAKHLVSKNTVIVKGKFRSISIEIRAMEYGPHFHTNPCATIM